MSRAGEPAPEIEADLGAVEVERRLGSGIVDAILGLLFVERRRTPGRELVEKMKVEAASLGADGLVDVQLGTRRDRGVLVLTLRGRAVRLRPPQPD